MEVGLLRSSFLVVNTPPGLSVYVSSNEILKTTAFQETTKSSIIMTHEKQNYCFIPFAFIAY